MKKKTKKTTKKVTKKVSPLVAAVIAQRKLKKLTTQDLIAEAIKDYKKDNSDWKSQTRDDMYGIESNIDALLYEDKYKHIDPTYGKDGTNELLLERLTFAAIKQITGRRHSCDTYYDDAFEGYDCMSEVSKASTKRGW